MITALLFNAFTGAVFGMTLGVSPVAGAVGANAIALAVSGVHSKMIFLICYLLDYQQVHDNVNVSIILLGDKKEPTK